MAKGVPVSESWWKAKVGEDDELRSEIVVQNTKLQQSGPWSCQSNSKCMKKGREQVRTIIQCSEMFTAGEGCLESAGKKEGTQ